MPRVKEASIHVLQDHITAWIKVHKILEQAEMEGLWGYTYLQKVALKLRLRRIVGEIGK